MGCALELPEKSRYCAKTAHTIAKQHLDKPQNFWRERKKIILSDESKTELYGHNHKRYVWRGVNEVYDEKYTIPTVRHAGGSLMCCGCA